MISTCSCYCFLVKFELLKNHHFHNIVGANYHEKTRKKKSKWDINKEYPKWAWVDYKYQDVKFFKEVRKLVAEGLDPEHELRDEHVITMVSFFGNVKTLETMNPLLPSDAKKNIETLYLKISGIGHITNNELMVWFVKGWITYIKGHPID